MLQSFLVYTLTAALLFFLGHNIAIRERCSLNKSHKHLSFGSLEIVLSILLFSFVSGARYKVGQDYLSYFNFYKEFKILGHFTRDNFEPGFTFITKIFATLDLHYFFYFAFWGALQISILYYAFRKEKYLLPYIGLFVMLGTYYSNWMNGIRQCVVTCFFVFFVKFICRKELLKYISCILLLSTIHKSALILLPCFIFSRWNFYVKNRFIWIALAICCVILGNTPSWIGLISNIETLFSFVGYDNYANNLDYWITHDINDMAWGPGRITTFLESLLVIFYYPKIRTFYKNKILDIYFILFFIGLCSFNLFSNTSHIFLRPTEYFTIFLLPLSVYLVYFFKQNKRRFMFVLFLILSCSHMFINLLKSYMYYDAEKDVFLYKFIWDYIS